MAFDWTRENHLSFAAGRFLGGAGRRRQRPPALGAVAQLAVHRRERRVGVAQRRAAVAAAAAAAAAVAAVAAEAADAADAADAAEARHRRPGGAAAALGPPLGLARLDVAGRRVAEPATFIGCCGIKHGVQ